MPELSHPNATPTQHYHKIIWHLVAGGPDVDGLADLSVELVLEVVDAAVLDDVVGDHSVGYEVPHSDALHPASSKVQKSKSDAGRYWSSEVEHRMRTIFVS